jgi:hypothetical protein
MVFILWIFYKYRKEVLFFCWGWVVGLLGCWIVGLLDCWIVGTTRVGINLRVDPTTRVVPTRVDPTGKTAAIDQWLFPTAMIPQKNPSRPNGIYKKRNFRAAKKRDFKYRKNGGKCCCRKYSEVRANGGYRPLPKSNLRHFMNEAVS